MKSDRLNPRPKIFLGLVNFGTQAGVLASYLRRMGYEAFSLTASDPHSRQTDRVLPHADGLLKGLGAKLRSYAIRLRCIYRYDIFHFFYGVTLLPFQLDLPLYRWLGKKVVMEYLGNDIQGYAASVNQYRWTNIAHMMSAEEGQAYDRRIQRRYRREQRYVDHSLVCAPCYSEFAPGAEFLPLALDLEQYPYSPPPACNGVLRIMHAPTHRGFKGTRYIVSAIERLQAEGFRVELDLVEGVSHVALRERYKECHLFIDQILGGWYGTASIEALAIGRPVVVFIRESYLAEVDFAAQLPFFNADPDTIYQVLREIVEAGSECLFPRSRSGRQFVEAHHDASSVTKRLLRTYQKLKPGSD